jgi:hypothetical protein
MRAASACGLWSSRLTSKGRSCVKQERSPSLSGECTERWQGKEHDTCAAAAVVSQPKWFTWNPTDSLPVEDFSKSADDMLYEQQQANRADRSKMPGSASGDIGVQGVKSLICPLLSGDLDLTELRGLPSAGPEHILSKTDSFDRQSIIE